jgi:hypothetical protein
MFNRIVVAIFIAVVAVAAIGTAIAAPTDAQKCLSSKLKEVGKYDSCRLKAEAKAVIKSEAPDYTKCVSKFTANWTKVETKAAGACPTNGDSAAIDADVVAHVADILAALSGPPAPVCGNSVAEAGEDCDGPDLGGGTCATEGFDYGSLLCTGSCTYDTTSCALSCDPVAQTCGVGNGCYHLDTSTAACAAAGATPHGGACTFVNNCVAGATCNAGFCAQYCDTTSPSCPIATTCQSFGFVPYPDAGMCL